MMTEAEKMAMAKGYEEMAKINLGISVEDFHLEDEGEVLNSYEMGTTEGKKKA